LIEAEGFCASLDVTGAEINVVEPGCNISFIDELFCGDSVAGNTENEDAGNWYTFTGTGEEVTFSTCNSANYDTRIIIFTDCGLNEVAENDDGEGCSGFTSELSFVADAGVVYEVFVTGYEGFNGTATGNYTLNVTCAAPPLPAPETSNTIVCGEVSQYEYCYGNSEFTTWLFTSDSGSALRMAFDSGLIEDYDVISIYDGTDNTGSLLYESEFDDSGNTDLSGVDVTSTGDSIYVEINSDGSVSCSSSPTYAGGWNFSLECAGDAVTGDSGIGVDNVTLDFTASPVPFGNEVFITYDFNFDTDVKIEVYDIRGALIRTTTDTNFRSGMKAKTRIDMSNLSNQVYIVRLTTNKGIVTKNIVSSKIRN
jgi:hypothetical protein